MDDLKSMRPARVLASDLITRQQPLKWLVVCDQRKWLTVVVVPEMGDRPYNC